MSLCSQPDCHRPRKVRGLCGTHAERVRRTGSADLPPRPVGCTMQDCEGQHYGRGLCRPHWQRLQRRGTLEQHTYAGLQRCTIDGCERVEALQRGWCRMHYQRWFRTGSTTDPAPRVIQPRLDVNGYRHVPHPSGRGYIAEHRHVMQQQLGRDLLPGENVHHLNGQRTDNRPENLELWVTPPRPGQRVTDLLAHARYIISTYGHLAD